MAWFVPLVGTLVSAGGGVSEGIEAKKYSRESAKDIERAKVREKATGEQEEKDYRDRQKKLMAEFEVRRAGSGTTSEGSPLLVASDMIGEIEEQAMRIKHGSELTQSRMETEKGLILRQGKRSEGAGYTRAGGSLLKGIGKAYGSAPVRTS